MAVSLAKFKEIANSSETELVRDSRKPAINNLTATELKHKASRARKLYDKWLDLSRSQARARSEKIGFGENKANTQLKVDAFAEALQNFEAKLDKEGIPKPTKKKVTKTKKTRNIGHRGKRSEVREELSAIQESLKEPTRKAKKKTATKKAATKKAPPRGEAPTEGLAAKKAAKKKTAKKTPPKSAPVGNTGLGLNKGKARQAKAAAKKGQVDRSGLTSRVRGHVSARGRRAQGRRDSRG
jgi:hypothetical protein